MSNDMHKEFHRTTARRILGGAQSDSSRSRQLPNDGHHLRAPKKLYEPECRSSAKPFAYSALLLLPQASTICLLSLAISLASTQSACPRSNAIAYDNRARSASTKFHVLKPVDSDDFTTSPTTYLLDQYPVVAACRAMFTNSCICFSIDDLYSRPGILLTPDWRGRTVTADDIAICPPPPA